MLTQEELTRRKILKKISEYALAGLTFSTTSTLIDAVYFKNIYIFYAFALCVFLDSMLIISYFLTFKKDIMKLDYYIIVFISLSLCTVIPLTYIAGGFAGAMISSYFLPIIIFALVLNRREAVLYSLLLALVYLFFFLAETYNFIKPLVTDVAVIRYSKVIIDILALFLITLIVTIISKNATDSINFYRLRNEKLSKMRKSLEILVNKRTKELNESNKKLKEAQSSLKKSYKKLQELDIKKDQFISIAAHELKTPLTSIGGYAQLLKNNRILRNAKKRKQFLDILDSEAKRLSQLVSEILNLSRIDLGVMRYKIEVFDVINLMKNLENEFSPKTKEKSLKYDFKIEKGISKIETDKEKLYEIMTNLIVNAIKFTPKGKITVTVDKRERYGSLLFSVEDTGIGIPKKYYKNIFERFFQVDTSYTRVTGGTGLGLSICKEYVKNLGGKIWFKSRLRKGTTFYVELPIKYSGKYA